MSYEFLQELSEARLFRNPSKMGEVFTSELADNFFNAVLALQTLKQVNPAAAQKYATQTLQSGSIDGWRSTGSDLHNMAYMLKNQERYAGKLTQDRHVSMPNLMFTSWLRNMSQGRDDKTYDRKFLLRLQRDLGVQSTGLRAARRLVADWDHALHDERKLAATRIHQGLRHNLQKSDMYAPYNSSMTKKALLIKDAEPAARMGIPLAAKVAGAAIGGYYLGKKFAGA